MINNARMTIGQIPILIILNMVLLHSLTNQCYTLDNENKYSLIHQSPHYCE